MKNKKWIFLGVIAFFSLLVFMVMYIVKKPSVNTALSKPSAITTVKITRVKDDPTNKRWAITINNFNASSKPLKSLFIGINVEGGSPGKEYKLTGSYKGLPAKTPESLPKNQFFYKIDDLKPGQNEWVEIYLTMNTPANLKITGFLVQSGENSTTISKSTKIDLIGK